MEALVRNWNSNDWITLLLVGCLLLIALVHFLYPRRFREFLLLPITDTYFHVQGKEGGLTHPFNLMLWSMQLIAVALFIYIAADLFPGFDRSDQDLTYLTVLSGYTAFVGFKFTTETLVSKALNMEPVIENYLYRKLTYRNLIALALLVSAVIFTYTLPPEPVYMWTIIGVVLLVNVLMLFYTYKSMNRLILRNFFYFILYLCALEISPYIILYYVLV
jgi:hypothetical protein